MILVSLGTQKFQMNRLIEAVDKIAPQIQEKIFIQTGCSTHIPKNCDYKDFVDAGEFRKMVGECSVLIAHAGVGTIMTGIKAGKPVIVVPRLQQFHEHVDDHQQQIAEAFAEKHCVLQCTDVEKLDKYIEKARTYDFQPYVVQGGNIEDIINSFIKIFE